MENPTPALSGAVPTRCGSPAATVDGMRRECAMTEPMRPDCDAATAFACGYRAGLLAATALAPAPETGGGETNAEQKLAALGVFKGAAGLRGLANAQSFWDEQPYGTRLYYGDGIADYLHRGALLTAVRALDESRLAVASQPPVR